MAKQIDLLQGTLDMLILKAVGLGPLHGYGVLLRIRQISGERLQIQHHSAVELLNRLEKKRLVRRARAASDRRAVPGVWAVIGMVQFVLFGSDFFREQPIVTSLFALLARVTGDRISYLQFLEDTFGTASTFRAAGTWHFRGVATGGDVSVGS